MGEGMPCEPHASIWVRYRNGEIEHLERANVEDWEHVEDDANFDIVAYCPVEFI